MWVNAVINASALSRGALVAGDEVVVRVGLWTAGVLAGLYAVRIALAWSLMTLVRVGPRRHSSQPRSSWQRQLAGTALRVAPRHARARLLRWSGVVVTASVVFATAVPLASAGTITPTPSASSTSSPSTSGDHVLLVLDRGTVNPSALTYPSASTRRVARTVVVHHGDTLWDMAARHLPGQVSNARIAAAWPQWYRLNRSVIGFDPNLIRPGMRIRTPAAYGEVTR